MKLRMLSIAMITLLAIGCGNKSESSKKNDKDTTTQKTDTNTIPVDNSSSFDPNASPESVVLVMIDAGKSKNYSGLKNICNSAIDMDGDAKDICSLADGKGDGEEFSDFFGNAKIKGPVRIKGDIAEVDITTSAEGGDEETIELERKDGKWYLKGF